MNQNGLLKNGIMEVIGVGGSLKMNDLFDVNKMLADLLAKQERYLLIRRVYDPIKERKMFFAKLYNDHNPQWDSCVMADSIGSLVNFIHADLAKEPRKQKIEDLLKRIVEVCRCSEEEQQDIRELLIEELE